MSAIIGVPINPKTAYILDKFLKNQEEIQKRSATEVNTIFATEDVTFAEKLRKILQKYSINHEIITFEPNRPKNAKDRIWNIVLARNAIRDYFLKSKAEYLIFMDADMIFEPEIVNKLIKIAEKGYDVVYNGYLDRGNPNGINLTGFGGTLIKRWVMEKVRFRCKEKNGRVVDEGVFFEFDLVKIGAKVYRGFIAYSEHHDPKRPPSICHPRELKLSERIRNDIRFRFISHAISIPLCYDILWNVSMMLKR
ncbi:Glycosyl transferase family 2 [Archaeoglobus fulgidus DSM 8774]|uniref:Glycosyl transferase family 2 n=1 Tax=Archaeoglobus fulgidus DSM 8774 TaxID=1344584 RepID=A0A075WAQ6_ARCFL|nr:glycosyltransferase [Archaeoglobus fulgidus]AIG97475.1 Glycosyl transferase family 2 [Archaeoglobus fulgidus DSM 8774]